MGLGPSAILGSTNKFFIPWLIPRNDRNSVYAPNLLSKLFNGRRKRDLNEVTINMVSTEEAERVLKGSNLSLNII